MRRSSGRFFVMGILAALVAAWQPQHAVAQSEQSGQLDLRDIDLDDPALISLLRLLSPQRDDSSADQTVTFYHLLLDFQRSPEKLVIRDGAMCHSLFAATIDGYADLPSGDLHFRGVLWPAYPAAVLERVMPARGIFLLPPSNSGLAGLSYKVVGTRDTPRLLINPFADVYPGPLRYVTEVCRQPDASGR